MSKRKRNRKNNKRRDDGSRNPNGGSSRPSGSNREHAEKRRQQSRERNRRKREKQAQQRRDIDSFLRQFDIDEYRQKARWLDRRFILHVGPTNSGKTYDAIQALKAAGSGVYLGPLRLLALEMYDTLNSYGALCELLTGEEFIRVPGAKLTASTIELCDYRKRYDVAVIDEAQMIADPHRGGNWTKAIFLVDAAEVHICLSPDAQDLICRILDGFDAEYEVIKHERLAPLTFAGKIDSIKEVQDGDAVIVFSRRAVLATAAELQQLGKKTSVIYGALPPASRREEVRKFSAGESTVVVSTDAIGMGISLPIRRIIFRELTKFDGEDDRTLNGSEIRQIAGRAGRYGIYDRGEVLTMSDAELVEDALSSEGIKLENVTIPFPREAIDTGYSFRRLFRQWQELPFVEGFMREDMTEATFLLNELGDKMARQIPRDLLYELITCPVDIKNDRLVLYWLECCIAISIGAEPEVPDFETDTLEGCELQYKALDVRHQLLRRIGIEDPRMDEKLELCERINELLMSDKRRFHRRCRICGKPLPATWSYGICDDCHARRRRRRRR